MLVVTVTDRVYYHNEDGTLLTIVESSIVPRRGDTVKYDDVRYRVYHVDHTVGAGHSATVYVWQPDDDSDLERVIRETLERQTSEADRPDPDGDTGSQRRRDGTFEGLPLPEDFDDEST